MKLLKASEICKLYNISRRSLYRWVKFGMIRGIRTPGGHLRFDIDEVGKLFSRSIPEPEKNQRVAG
jgi:excisionase family DNA binding protein